MSNSDEQRQKELMTASMDHALHMGEAWLRLQKNGDFKKIITNGYLKEKVLASASLLGVPQERDRRGMIMEDLISASNLEFFFRMIENQYEAVKNPILTDEEERLMEEAAAAEASGEVN